MPKKKNRNSANAGDENSGSLRGALGGFFGASPAAGGGTGNMFGNMSDLFGGKQEIVDKRAEPFGKASARAAADEDDDDSDESPTESPRRVNLSASGPTLKLPSPDEARIHAEARRKQQEEEEDKIREEALRKQQEDESQRKQAEERKQEEEKARRKQEAEQEETRRKKEADDAAAAQKKFDAAKVEEARRSDAAKVEEARRKKEAEDAAAAQKKSDASKAEAAKAQKESRERELRAAEQKQAQKITGLISVQPRRPVSQGKETKEDKINQLLLQHSSKWEVQVKVDDNMAASWISHVQARSLMQQLRLRLLQTPLGGDGERPNLTTVVASGLVEFGALNDDQRRAFLGSSGGSGIDLKSLKVSVLVHETEKPNAPALLAMTLDTQLPKAQADLLAEGLGRLKYVNSTQKSKVSSWGAASRSKDAEIPRSVGTMSAMLTAGLFTWDRLKEE